MDILSRPFRPMLDVRQTGPTPVVCPTAPRLPRAYILAGGLGLRLRSVVADRPKALAEVGGRPFLDFVIGQIAAHGGMAITLCTGYGTEAVRSAVGDGSRWGIRVDVSAEDRPLGTAGALRLALTATGREGSEALVVNGDSFFDVPSADLVAAHRAANADLTIALHRATDAGRFGTIEIAGDRVIAFREKAEVGPALINGGIYVLRPAVVDRLPAGEPASLERDLFPALICDPTAIVIGRSFPGFFTDIGVPADYGRIRAMLPPEMAAYAGASA